MTPEQKMAQILSQANLIIKEEIERALKYLGEQCVTRVRDRSGEDSWFDVTGNLRSSIGYAIYEHGVEVLRSAFDVVKNGSAGKSAGENYISSLVSQYSSTYALVVVAAMNYADFVEAKESKDVLASTELWARTKIDNYLEQAVEKAERRINAMI